LFEEKPTVIKRHEKNCRYGFRIRPEGIEKKMEAANMVTVKPTLRKARAERRRHNILDTALNIFAMRGFAETTVKDIADAADISNGSLYSYFSSKDQLLEAVAERYNFLPEFRILLKGTNKQPCREALGNIAHGFIRLLEQRNKILRIFLRENFSNTKVQHIWSNLTLECTSLLKKQLADRIEAGELKCHNTEVTARCLFSVLIMFIFTQSIFKSSNVTEYQFVEDLLNNLLQGIQNNGK
jgi:AcrR family transcriptional regulator